MRLFRTEGGPIVIVLRSEVWRGRSGAIVSTWDPDAPSLGLVLDTWTSAPTETMVSPSARLSLRLVISAATRSRA